MRNVIVSIPTAVSGAMRLYVAYVLLSLSLDPILLVGAFFLTLSIYSFDRIEDYGGRTYYSILFTSSA